MTKILVTGGASGLGRSIVKTLAQNESLFVYFTYFNSMDTASSLEKEFDNVRSIPCDFSKTDQLDKLLQIFEQENIDVLINNALPAFSQKQFYKVEAEEVGASFSQNVSPVMTLMLKAVKLFKKRKSGKIINILSSSTHGIPPLGYALYTAEKKYIESVSKSIASETAKFNIQINCISPSFMTTDLNSYLDPRVVEEMQKSALQKEFLNPIEVAKLTLFLVQSENGYLNGQNINLNGGR